LNHSKRGTVSFSCSQQGEEEGDLVTGSQFFITLQDGLDYLDGKHAPFGTVVEGLEEGGTIEKIDKAFVDEGKRPLRDIRILRAVVLGEFRTKWGERTRWKRADDDRVSMRSDHEVIEERKAESSGEGGGG